MSHRTKNDPEAPPMSVQDGIEASICRDSFWEFVCSFWNEVPGSEPMVANWHMKFMCDELQAMAERVFADLPAEYDLLINISPGTSKSTICSILFQPWTWTRMPRARHIVASHTDTLVLDLATKARTVIESDKYRRFFPDIQLKRDQDTKSYYSNTMGGDRYSCTVGGKSPTGFHGHFLSFDDPLDPQKALSAAELLKAGEFKTTVLETRKVDKLISCFFGVMQRVHSTDPSGVMLEKAKNEGAKPIRHICLPARIDPDSDNVQPPELKQFYKEGLMDPVRLNKRVLDTFLVAMGQYGFSGQFMQSPVPLSGGLFKQHYFNNRVKAAPYDCARIRYWDRAATQGAGCFSAGVLIGKDSAGLYYTEHAVHGQWEPIERNRVMRATALRDRAKYGQYAPTIVVESEGGSSGRDAWLGVVKALDGFYVKEDRPTGSKETRAEPWSTQLAAGSVRLVEDGTWDINGYISEHCLFPLGKYKDLVDASTGAYNLLVNRRAAGTVRVLGFDRRKKGQLMIAVANREDADALPVENRKYITVNLQDPVGSQVKFSSPEQPALMTGESVEVSFADIDPSLIQDRWEEEVEGYGRKPEELVMTREQGRDIWKFILKQRDRQPEIIVVLDSGDGRALSTAYAMADALRLPRSVIYQASDPESKCDGKPPNPYIYETTKNSKGMVCG